MATRKKTKAQIDAQLKRAIASLNARSTEYPNIPRSGYNLKQQEAYVKKHPGTMDWNSGSVSRKMNSMINFADRQEDKRERQLREAADRLRAQASNGG